jgi:heme exporter protein C
VALLALLAALLILSPAEAQLGNLIKVIYLHGALARVGLYALMLAALPALAYLIRPRPALLRWSNATQVAGMIVFVVHFALSVIPTHATWGVWIAFDEPRTRMTLQIVGVGLLVIVVRHLIDDRRFSAVANLLLGAAVLLLNLRTGVLRHPLNPIGESTSSAIQLYYAGILLTCAALTGLLAWWLARRTMNADR